MKPSRRFYDTIVVGGGNAGLCAAIAAVEQGGRVLLVERSPIESRGGNTKYTRDIRVAHDRGPYVSGPYSEEEFLEDIVRVNRGDTDRELAELVVSRSRDLPGWMEKHGVRWQKPLKGSLHLSRTNMFFLGGGKALLNAYYRYASRLGVEVLYGATLRDLVVEGDTFREAVIDVGGRTLRVEADSVVLASGGFEANISWLKRYWGDAAENFIVRGSRFNDGLVLEILARAGARLVGDPREAHMVAVDARSPRYDGGIVTRVDSIPFGIVVNAHAKRFYDEGEDEWPKRYAMWGRLVAEQPGQVAYSIFDSKVVGLFIQPIYPPYTSSDLRDLAVKIGLDPDRLLKTVGEFNSSVVDDCSFRPGKLDDCRAVGIDPPKSHWALKIDKPPFYAYPLRPGITFTYMGVAVDKSARVARSSGGFFRNIYAAGEIMMGNILRRGYLGGLGLTIGSVFGIIAGERSVGG